MSTDRLVTSLRTSEGGFAISYKGPIGLRGGRYEIVATDPNIRPVFAQRVVLTDLIILRDHLTEEIERAATPGG